MYFFMLYAFRAHKFPPDVNISSDNYHNKTTARKLASSVYLCTLDVIVVFQQDIFARAHYVD